jgi:hypothetical protein
VIGRAGELVARRSLDSYEAVARWRRQDDDGLLGRLPQYCHVVETGNESWRLMNRDLIQTHSLPRGRPRRSAYGSVDLLPWGSLAEGADHRGAA